MYEATVTAKFNSQKITEYIKLTEQEKARRIRQSRNSREKFKALDRDYEELRKNARNKTPYQIQSEIKNLDDKVTDLEKRREQNKSSRRKITTPKIKTLQKRISRKQQPMKFSSSVELGKFGWTNYGGFGVSIKNANLVTEKPKIDSGVSVYSKGVARFIQHIKRNYVEKIYCKGDSIIVEYMSWEDYGKVKGEFRFKWDESAQWFSVEQVKY